MSTHAQLTPEAARILHNQRKQSIIASLFIAILTIALVSTLFTFLLVKGLTLTPPKLIIQPSTSKADPPPQPQPTPTSIQKKPSTPRQAAIPTIIAQAFSPTSIPVVEITTPTLSAELGNNADIGIGWNGNGQGGPTKDIPSPLRKRCSAADRLQRLADNGGNEACEASVTKALHWLKTHQNKNGSWGNQKPVAMTGLALLSFLGHCEDPSSIEYGAAVTDGILYLLDNSLKQNGKCASDLKDKHWCYEHAIAVYALSESYLFCKGLNTEFASEIKEATRTGTQWIIDNQTEAGGWDYGYASDGRPGDSSIVAWHLQALKAASLTGIRFPKLKKTIGNGLEFLAGCQNENGGFGYTLNKKPVGGAKGHFSLTGAGALCFQQHKGSSNSNARKGIRYLSQNTRFDFAAGEVNLYEHYYASQAFINHSGQEWRTYNGIVRDQLLKHQNKDGSWPNTRGPGSHSDPVYSTALATLMLEVYYRYLPGTSTSR